jgi:molybdate transport system substrate-binding protein
MRASVRLDDSDQWTCETMLKHIATSMLMAMLLAPFTARAQIHVLISGGIRAAYDRLLPQFEKQTGRSVSTAQGTSQGAGADSIAAQLRHGTMEDVVIMSKAGFKVLIADGRVKAGAIVDLARVPLGVAVRAGDPKPDIHSVAAFRQALLNAPSIASDSTAALYLRNKLLPELGISAKVLPNLVLFGSTAISTGQAEMVIDPVSAVLHAPGAQYVGALPDQIQLIQTFSAAIVSNSTQADAARQLLAFLTSTDARAAMRASGMDPIH